MQGYHKVNTNCEPTKAIYCVCRTGSYSKIIAITFDEMNNWDNLGLLYYATIYWLPNKVVYSLAYRPVVLYQCWIFDTLTLCE